MKIRYIAIGNFQKDFTYSRAAYNRISLTCAGLRLKGFEADMYGIYSTLLKNKYLRYFGHLHCIIKTLTIFFVSKKSDVIIVYGENPYSFLFKLFHKRTRLFAELHEYPLYLISNSMSSAGIRVSNKFQQSLQYAEGIITCSYILKDYHQKHTSPDSRYLVSPLLLDFDKFAGKPFDREKYIAYCGDFGNNKDGIPTLINAFSIISTKYSDYQLRIAGGAKDKSVMINLMALVTELGLEEKIRFMGMIEHNKMPEFLGKASLLALARPYNLQAEAGFPSKIAEYLSTGRPVVVTKVGELNLYLRHKENVFFSDSDDAESFAKCLDMVLSDYPNAFKIGLSGRKVAENFDYKKQTDLIADFLLKND